MSVATSNSRSLVSRRDARVRLLSACGSNANPTWEKSYVFEK